MQKHTSNRHRRHRTAAKRRVLLLLLLFSLTLSALSGYAEGSGADTPAPTPAGEAPTQADPQPSTQASADSAQPLPTETEPIVSEEQAVTAAVTSTPVINNTNYTTIVPAYGVDMTIGTTQHLRVRTSLSDATSVSVAVDKTGIVTLGQPGPLELGDAYFTITAAHTGTVKITATVNRTSGIEEVVSIEIYVTMEDGIYLIQSCATHLPNDMGNYYLRVEDVGSDTPQIHASTNTYGDMTDNIYRYWHTEYAGNGQYYIRSLAGGGMTLCPDTDDMTKVTAKSMAVKWIISYRNGGHEIASAIPALNGKSMILSTFTVQTGYYSPTQGYYYVEPTLYEVQNMAFERWNFIAQDISGVFFRNNATRIVCETITKTAISNSTLTLEDWGYSLVAYDSTTTSPPILWESSNTAVATVSSSGTITTLKPGIITITARIVESNQSASFTLKVLTPGIMDNTSYYVMNYSTGRYMALASATDANLTNVVTMAKTTANHARWRVDMQSKEYQLISVYSSAGRVLDVTNGNVDIFTDNNASYQIFGIERIESGTYKGLYYIRYGDNYVAQDSSNNVCIVTSPSAAAVWSFMKVTKGNAEMYCVNVPQMVIDGATQSALNATGQAENFENIFQTIGYQANVSINHSATAGYNALQNSDIWVFAGHAKPGYMVFNELQTENRSGTWGNGFIVINDGIYPGGESGIEHYIEDLPPNALSSLRCVLLLGCETAVNKNQSNLVDAIYEKGAHFVLGTSARIDNAVADAWQEAFMESIAAGNTIEYSINEAASALNYTGVDMIYVGDTAQYLN